MIERVYFKVEAWKDAGAWSERDADIPTLSQAVHIAEKLDAEFPQCVHRIVQVTEELVNA